MTFNRKSRPKLALGCRLNERTEHPRMLLGKEHGLRLQGPSLEIVQRCDDLHTVNQIIEDLQKLYSKAEATRVEQDVLSYLALLHNQGYIELA
jgi:hypothetical protein